MASAPQTPATVTETAGTQIGVTQHNILGDHYNSLYYNAVASAPLVITAQEVCDQAVQNLSDLLYVHGYRTIAVSGFRSSLCGNDKIWIAVAVKAAIPGSETYGYIVSGRNRVWGCYVGRYGETWRGCTFHLTSAEVSRVDAWEESMEMHQKLITGVAREPTVVGADFNLRPREFAPYNTQYWKDSWYEGDNRCYLRNMDRKTYTSSGETYYRACPSSGYLRDTKIDYTWADKFNFVEAYGLAGIENPSGSDHYMYVSAFLYK